MTYRDRFEAVYDAYCPAIHQYAARRTGSPEDAADVISETFLTAWRRIGDVPEGEEALLWLYGVARRVLANQQRGESRRAVLAERLRAELAADRPVRPVDLDHVRTAFDGLPERDREVLALACWEGLTSQQIAKVMKCTAITARAAPEGAYWHLKELYVGSAGPYGENGNTYRLETPYLSETWVAKDGRGWIGRRQMAARPLDVEAWRRDGSPTEWEMGKDGGVYSTSPGEGTLTRLKGEQKLYWSAMPLTLKEIEALPADPEALKKRAAEAIRRDQDFAGSVEDGLPPALASLLYELPASPQVRSAAYRALATLPAVRVEGRTTDAQGRQGVSVTFPIQDGRPTQGRLGRGGRPQRKPAGQPGCVRPR